jgi:hypothetical protein
MPFPGFVLLVYIIKIKVAGWCDVKSYRVPKSLDKTNKDKKKERKKEAAPTLSQSASTF